MLLTLPFQGMASTALRACAHKALAPHGVAAAPAMHADAQHAQNGHESARHGHCHGEETDAAPAPAPDDDRSTAQHDDGRCSACAACCMAAALAPAPALPAAAPGAPAGFDTNAGGRLAAVDLALPERPPRSPLA